MCNEKLFAVFRINFITWLNPQTAFYIKKSQINFIEARKTIPLRSNLAVQSIFERSNLNDCDHISQVDLFCLFKLVINKIKFHIDFLGLMFKSFSLKKIARLKDKLKFLRQSLSKNKMETHSNAHLVDDMFKYISI